MNDANLHLTLALTFIAVALGGCVPPKVSQLVSTHPTFRPSVGEASQIGAGLNGYSQATVPKAGLIVVEGDGVVYGATAPGHRTAKTPDAATRRSRQPFPELLQGLLGVQVENRGFPGDTITEGEARWAGRSSGDLLIVSYGFADANAKTPPAEFAAALDRILTKAHAGGAAIMLLVPPVYADKSLTAEAEAYRNAMRQAEAKYGASLFELNTILTSTTPHPTDGSYEADNGYRAIAYTIAPYIAVASSPRPPAF